MAIYASTALSCTIGGVDLSDHITRVSLNTSADEIDTTAFGDSQRTLIGGLQSGSVSIDFHNDFAASEVYATLTATGLGSAAAVVVKPNSGSTSATNPSKTANCLITELPFLDDSVGELGTISVTWPISGPIVTATS